MVIFTINPAFRQLEPALRAIAVNGLPADADIIYSGRNVIARIVIDGFPVIVKSFRKPGFINALAYTTVRQSKARRSYLNSLKLLSLGFDAPAPIAFAERRDGLLLRESYYFSAEISGDDLRYWERRDDAADLTAALARELHRLTAAGVCHLDLSPGNVIFRRINGKYAFSFIDLNRMDFNVTSRNKLLRSIFERIAELDSVVMLARAYAAVTGDDEAEIVAAARRFRLDFVKKMDMKRKLKSLWKKK